MKTLIEYINETVKKSNWKFDLTDEEKEEIVKYINKQIHGVKKFINDFYIDKFGYEDSIRNVCFNWVQDTYNIPVADGVKYTITSDEDEQKIDEIIDWLSQEVDKLIDAVSKKMNWYHE